VVKSRRMRSRWKENSKMKLREIEWAGFMWLRIETFVNTVMNLRVL
jgi:hypothetical protein